MSNAFPNGEVARFTPIGIGEATLCTRAIGMHDVAHGGIATEDIGDDLAESFGIETFVNIFDGVVHVLFGGTYAAQAVSLVV